MIGWDIFRISNYNKNKKKHIRMQIYICSKAEQSLVGSACGNRGRCRCVQIGFNAADRLARLGGRHGTPIVFIIVVDRIQIATGGGHNQRLVSATSSSSSSVASVCA